MSSEIAAIAKKEYEHGFVTDIESDTLPPGLDEGVIGFACKGEAHARLPAVN